MPHIRITKASSERYWYRFAIGKVVYAYTIETGKALIRNDDVERLLATVKHDLHKTDFKGYIFDGDYEIGELIDSYEEVFSPFVPTE